MNKTFAALAAAFTAMAAPAAFAQSATPDTPEGVVSRVCATIAANPQSGATCTPAQRAKAIKDLEKIVARGPAADVFEQMKNMYDATEVLRRVFFPDQPPLPLPPRDRADLGAYELCGEILQNLGRECTTEQREGIREMILRLNEMPPAQTPEAAEARRNEVRSTLDRLFPDMPRRAPPARRMPPSGPVLIA